MKIRELEAALKKSEQDKESLRVNIQAIITDIDYNSLFIVGTDYQGSRNSNY